MPSRRNKVPRLSFNYLIFLREKARTFLFFLPFIKKQYIKRRSYKDRLKRHITHHPIQNSVSLTIVVALLVTIILPVATAYAARTMTWNTDGDFAFNKVAGCEPAIQTNVAVSSEQYTDATCAMADVNASMKLKAAGIPFRDVLDVSGTFATTYILKTDNTVWALGYNVGGELGIGTNVTTQIPVQVKNSSGSGFLTNIIALATDDTNNAYALKDDGTVWAWGNNTNGQYGNGTTSSGTLPVQMKDPTGTGVLTNITAIAAGGDTFAALKNDGTVWTVGSNGSGQLGDGTTVRKTLPVQVKGIAGTGNLTNITMIAVIGSSIVALRDDKTVVAWGGNTYGQLGNNTLTQSLYPNYVLNESGTGNLTDVTSIAIGDIGSVFVIKTDTTVWSWGWNGFNQLGDGTTSNRSLPVQVKDANGAFLSNVVQLSASFSVLALKDDGTVWSWGSGGSGTLGLGTSQNTTVFATQIPNTDINNGLTSITKVRAEGSVTFFVTNDATLMGCGSNSSGVLGQPYGITTDVLSPKFLEQPTQSTTVNGFTKVSNSSGGLSVGLKSDGTVWEWGVDYNGSLGGSQSPLKSIRQPMQVKDASGTGFLTNIISVSMGGQGNALALKNDGTVWSWGYGFNGQLGDGTSTLQLLPVQVKDSSGAGFLTGVASINAGYINSYAVKSDGTVWAWGDNTNGQLGNATTTNSSLPVQVKGVGGSGFLTGVASVVSGGQQNNSAVLTSFAVAVKTDGTIFAWGGNGSGQLGDNTSTNRSTPVQVKGVGGTGTLTGVSSVGTGLGHVVAVKTDGTVWAWGDNTYGQLGDNTIVTKATPVQVKGVGGTGTLTNASKVSGGWSSSYITKLDGTAWSWGYNGNGELGDGTTTNRRTPVQVKGVNNSGLLANVSNLSAGQSKASAVLSDGSIVSWGIQYLDGSSVSTTFPLRAVIYSSSPGYSVKGTSSNYITDAGEGRRTKWTGLDWSTDSLPANTTVSFSVRTSDNKTEWSNWTTGSVQSSTGSTGGSDTFSTVAFSRFLEIRVNLGSPSYTATPTLNDFSLHYLEDTIAPANASSVGMKTSSNGSSIASNGWLNNAQPYFNWTAGTDDIGGTGIQGYCLYLGQDSQADLTTSKGLLGESPHNSLGQCAYTTTDTYLDIASHPLSAALVSSSSQYHLLIKAIDNAGNITTAPAASFSFRYDSTAPTPPTFISAPAQFVSDKNVTMTWPTNGSQSSADAHSGIAGLQYRIGENGIWYGDSHTGSQDLTDMLQNDGSYTFDPAVDYPNIQEGVNTVYFRSIDSAGNPSVIYATAAIKLNTSAPSSPQNVLATPTSNIANSFSFSWNAPATYIGSESGLTYCYTVNTLPTPQTCTYTSQRLLAADAFATQPGENTFYVVAKDEAGNINYSTHSSVTFTANTPAPGIPTRVELADISTKATSTWKLAVSWTAPEDAGAGISKYVVYRSTNGTTFAQIATTSGTSYVDSNLGQQAYYYKMKACDSANNCGAFSELVTTTPTGRYTSPAELVTNPTVEVSARKATIKWLTDRDSHSQVQFGVTAGVYFPSEVANNLQTREHSVELLNLQENTKYFYKTLWTDEDGNTGRSNEFSFTTLSAPTIKDVSVIRQTLNSATIQFTSKDAVKVDLAYGTTESYGGLQSLNTSRNESTYKIELTGLSDDTTYLYKLITTDADGSIYNSYKNSSFTTPPRPIISNIRFQPLVGEPTSTQEISWSTNIPTDSLISYGKIGAQTQDVASSVLTKEHAIIIKNLQDDSTYVLQVQSRDADGNLAQTERREFKTALDTRPPKVSEQQVSTSIKGTGTEARGQVIISWKTDEPSTSQVAYGGAAKNGQYANTTAEDTKLTTDHVVVISDLPVSSVYHIQPVSRDKSQNAGKGTDQSAIVGRASESVLTIIFNSLYRIFGL